MKNIAMVLLLSTISVFAQDVTKTTVAVIDFEAQGISEVDASILANRFRSELVNTQAFFVLERGQMDDILNEVGFQRSGCTSSECMIEIGKLLNVQKMIGGSLGKLGTVFTIDLRLIDVQTGRIDKTVSEDHAGQMTDLLKVMKNIAMRFAALEAERSAPKVSSGTGRIQIVTKPAGAEIFLNNRKIGESPFMGEQLKTGEYRLRLAKEDFQDFETTLVILDNQLTEISQNLVALYELSVLSEPEGSTVYINAAEIGKTPVTKKLPQGNYEVKITRTNFKDWVRHFNLTRSGKVTAKMELTDEYLARVRQTQEKAAEPALTGETGGGNTWLWVGAGAVVAGGAAYLLLKPGDSENGAVIPASALPTPPARPE